MGARFYAEGAPPDISRACLIIGIDSWSYGNGLISTAATVWLQRALAFSGDRFTISGKQCNDVWPRGYA